MMNYRCEDVGLEEISKQVTQHGGVYAKKLERPVKVTYLLCSVTKKPGKSPPPASSVSLSDKTNTCRKTVPVHLSRTTNPASLPLYNALVPRHSRCVGLSSTGVATRYLAANSSKATLKPLPATHAPTIPSPSSPEAKRTCTVNHNTGESFQASSKACQWGIPVVIGGSVPGAGLVDDEGAVVAAQLVIVEEAPLDAIPAYDDSTDSFGVQQLDELKPRGVRVAHVARRSGNNG
ncbi:hypothetical protein H0H81_012568 [Sphagnurus paluster]|uniref:Uncharacterized protein n=1 Tax=Sphagnurus paluster TaxID=117069 RepID=A0A9P7GGU8_9AGAR|nr:hypothetical protein H0H81_012568 [Sphagnurus paluster]